MEKKSKIKSKAYSRNDLVIFTNSFPYGKGEAFLKVELEYLSCKFNNILVIPFKTDDKICRKMPTNVSTLKVDLKAPSVRVQLAFTVTFIKFYLVDIKNSSRPFLILSSFRRYLSIFRSAVQKTVFLEEAIGDLSTKNYYSYWMNNWALSLAILKERGKIDGFLFRTHGYDLYEYRNFKNLIPFKYSCYRAAKQIFPISQDGYNYLRTKGVSEDKLTLARLGTLEINSPPLEESEIFTMVSCSSLIPLKRVTLIAQSLKHIKHPLKWIHFGGGPEFDKVYTLAMENKNDNHCLDIRGDVENNAILLFYKQNVVNLFLNVSEFEGLPFSIMEAISGGIPILATNVGGTKEIVTNETGVLMPHSLTPQILGQEIANFIDSPMNSREFRERAKLFWKMNFNADTNFRMFVKHLICNIEDEGKDS